MVLTEAQAQMIWDHACFMAETAIAAIWLILVVVVAVEGFLWIKRRLGF